MAHRSAESNIEHRRKAPTLPELERELEQLLEELPVVNREDIPRIDLYMDQLTTFMEDHLKTETRGSEKDKGLTKTMVNNYVKNGVLLPPVRKKYSSDHLRLLLFIYYMKSFLSISDISRVIGPVSDTYARPTTMEAEDPSRQYRLADVYQEVADDVRDCVESFHGDLQDQLDKAAASFEGAPESDREQLQRFDLLIRLSADIYVRKRCIEKIIDML